MASFFPPIAAAIPNASAVQNGLMANTDFVKLSTVPDGAALAAWNYTATIDFLATAPVQYAMPLPTFAGKSLVGVVGRLVWVAKTGTATGGFSFSIGNNVTFDNFVTAANGAVSTVTINAATAGTVLALNAGSGSPSMANALSVNVLSNPTGVTVLTGYFVYAGMYV